METKKFPCLIGRIGMGFIVLIAGVIGGFHASQVGSEYVLFFYVNYAFMCFHASQVGSEYEIVLSDSQNCTSFHASQVGSECSVSLLLDQPVTEVSMPHRQDRNDFDDYVMNLYRLRFPCLIGRIGMVYRAQIDDDGVLFPCLIGRIGMLKNRGLFLCVSPMFPCLIGRIGILKML